MHWLLQPMALLEAKWRSSHKFQSHFNTKFLSSPQFQHILKPSLCLTSFYLLYIILRSAIIMNLLYSSVDTISSRAFHEQIIDFIREPNSWKGKHQTGISRKYHLTWWIMKRLFTMIESGTRYNKQLQYLDKLPRLKHVSQLRLPMQTMFFVWQWLDRQTCSSLCMCASETVFMGKVSFMWKSRDL